MDITIYKSLYDKKPTYSNPERVLQQFKKQGEHYVTIEKIRSSSDKDEITNFKKTLPIVCFGGKFNERKKSGLLHSSGLLVLDFDSGKGFEMKERFAKSKYTYAAFISPSGKKKGCKVVVRIPDVKDDEEYKEYFEFFEQNYGVDKSGKDISRACFISYDPDLYINPNAEIFTKDMMKRFTQPKESQSEKIIKQCEGIIATSSEGQGHASCLKAGMLLGGYAVTGIVQEGEGVSRLNAVASIRRPKKIADSEKAISDGVEEGKRKPITDMARLDYEVSVFKPPIDPNSFVVTREKIDEQTHNYYEGTGVKSYKTGIELLDYYFSYRPNTFYTKTGGKAAGKTTLKLYINTFFAVKHKLKYLIISFENDAFELEQEVIGFLSGNSAEYVYRTNKVQYNKLKEFFHEHFTVLNFPPDYRFLDILEAVRKINSQSQYHELLIDPLFKLAGTDDYSENKLIARHAEPFANEEMSLWVQMHPKTSSQRDGGHTSDLQAEFGGLYSNAADITIAVSRFYKDENESVRNTVNMSIDKVRSKKLLGGMETVTNCPIKWEYNWKNHNYSLHLPSIKDPNSYECFPDGLLQRSDINLY